MTMDTMRLPSVVVPSVRWEGPSAWANAGPAMSADASRAGMIGFSRISAPSVLVLATPRRSGGAFFRPQWLAADEHTLIFRLHQVNDALVDRKFHHTFTLRIGACDIWVQDDADRVDRLGGLRNGDHACLAQLWTIAEKFGRIGLGNAFFEAQLFQPLAIKGRQIGRPEDRSACRERVCQSV